MILAIIAFHRDVFNQYFIIIASIMITNNSQIIVYHNHSSIIKGRTNHKNGSVIVVGSIQNKISFQLEILSFFRNNFAIVKRIIVSVKIAINRACGKSFLCDSNDIS